MDNEFQKLFELCYLNINHTTTKYQNIYNTTLKKHLNSYKIERSIILDHLLPWLFLLQERPGLVGTRGKLALYLIYVFHLCIYDEDVEIWKNGINTWG